jgi:hypothetical protein
LVSNREVTDWKVSEEKNRKSLLYRYKFQSVEKWKKIGEKYKTLREMRIQYRVFVGKAKRVIRGIYLIDLRVEGI